MTKVASESEEEESEPVKPIRKRSRDVKKPAKKVEMEEEEESEEAPKPVKGRKGSKDLKTTGKKINNEDEEGEFEVCVQQLSFHAYDADVRSHFEPCGSVLNVKLLTKPDGKSKGTAFVKFGWKSEYNQALELDGSELMGRAIKVSEAQKKDNDANGRGFQNNSRPQRTFDKPEGDAVIETSTLFIGSLSFKSTPDSMKKFFSRCGDVVGARIVTDRETERVNICVIVESRFWVCRIHRC